MLFFSSSLKEQMSVNEFISLCEHANTSFWARVLEKLVTVFKNYYQKVCKLIKNDKFILIFTK